MTLISTTSPPGQPGYRLASTPSLTASVTGGSMHPACRAQLSIDSWALSLVDGGGGGPTAGSVWSAASGSEVSVSPQTRRVLVS
jgi:hypothetical protein